MVQAILRFYSYVFQALVSLICLALGVVASLSDNTTFAIDLLPWTDRELRLWLLAIGMGGLLATLLAFKGKWRILFLLFSAGTTFLMARGIFISNHQFNGETDFQWALFLLLGFFATILGAWSRFRQPIGR